MKRTVTSHLDLTLSGPAKLVFSVAVAHGAPFASEELALVADGEPVQPQELVDVNGTRLHVLETAAEKVTLDYRAVVDGQFPTPAVDDLDLVTYLRPSRYCESDSLAPTAAA